MKQSAWVRAELLLAPCLVLLLSQDCGGCWAGLVSILRNIRNGVRNRTYVALSLLDLPRLWLSAGQSLAIAARLLPLAVPTLLSSMNWSRPYFELIRAALKCPTKQLSGRKVALV